MATSLSGSSIAVIGGGKDAQGGVTHHKESEVVPNVVQRGAVEHEAIDVDDVDYAVRQESELLEALVHTHAAAGGELGENSSQADSLFSMEGLDELSTALVTKKLMDNMLVKGPSVAVSTLGLSEIVADKLKRSRFAARKMKDVNLLSSRWDQNKLNVYPIRSGATVDTLVPIAFERTIKVTNLIDAAYITLSSDTEQEELGENFDLQKLREEVALEILASGFVKTGVDYVEEVIKRSLTSDSQDGEDQLKKKLLKMKNHAEMVAYVRDLGLVREIDFKSAMQNMILADLINLMIEETKKAVVTSLESYAIISNLTNKEETVNCRLFRFTCVGSALINARIGSTKSFKLSVDNNEYLSQVVISLRCVENRGRVSILRLEVIGDVTLGQRAVVRLYSGLYRSTGVIDASTSEVISIQNDVFDGFMTAALIDFADENENYAVLNASGLVPMMVLGGIVPDNLEDPATNICWQISLRSIVNNLCRLNRVFDSSIDRNHFLFSFKTALIISSGLEELIETKKFIAQFFLWARFVNKNSNTVYTDYYVNSLANNKNQKSNSGLGAQCLWVASALLEMSEICETGYRYLPIIIFYNMLSSGECSAKLVNMGVWLANSLSLNTDRSAEDKKLMETMEMLGVPVTIDWRRRLSMQLDVGSKIAIAVEMLREHMSDIIPLVTGTSCTKTEAALLCKVALMELDEDDSGSDVSTVDYVAEISALVFNKMKNSAEQGEMSHDDYLILVKEVARDMEDDDEVKQVLNTEGTKYRVVYDKLYEKKVAIASAAGKWKSTSVGEAPSNYRRREMEQRLMRDFTNQNIAFSERARNTMYQLTDFNSSTMRDTLNLNGAIITSFLHRMGSLGGKDINVLLSKLAGKGVEGTSALLSANDVKLLSVSNLETNVSERGESSSMSSTTKLTLLEGLSVTVGISRTFDLKKMMEAISRLTREESRSSLKLKENLKKKEVRLLEQTSDETHASEDGSAILVTRKQIIAAYFSSFIQELEECFTILECDDGEPAFKRVKKTMLVSAGLPMSILNCITVVIRRLADLVWDSITYLYDEIDESSKEQESALVDGSSSRAKKAAKLSMEALKVALSSALISYKVTFTTYFSVAEGTVCLMKRISLKLSRKLYLLVERELVFFEVFLGFSADVVRARKYIDGRRLFLCVSVTAEHSDSAQQQGTQVVNGTLTKAEEILCVAVKPVRAANKLIAATANKLYMSFFFCSSRALNFLFFLKHKIVALYRNTVNKTRKSIKAMTSSFKAASGLILNLSSKLSFEKANKSDGVDEVAEQNSDSSAAAEVRRNKGKEVVEDDGAGYSRSLAVSACGLPVIDSLRRSVLMEGEASSRGELEEPATALNDEGRREDRRMTDQQYDLPAEAAGASSLMQGSNGSQQDVASAVNTQAVLRVIVKRENRFTRFVRVIATRLCLVTKLLLEEWADTVEDVVYLVFSRTGYADKRNVVRLSVELDAGSLRDYEQRKLAEAAKNRFYFRVYRTAHESCQKAHSKFVDVVEWLVSKVEKFRAVCAKFVTIITDGANRAKVMTSAVSLALFHRCVIESAALPDEELREICSSVEDESSFKCSSASSQAGRASGCSKDHRSRVAERHRIAKENDEAVERQDANINQWLMMQDERCYERCSGSTANSEELQESREAYFSFFNSGRPRDVKVSGYPKNASQLFSESLDSLETVRVEAHNEGDGVVALRSVGGAHVSDGAISSIVNAIRTRISEVVWMHETSCYLQKELEARPGVNWVLSSIAGTERKHLLRHVGETNFDKLVILTGDLTDSGLLAVEKCFNEAVSRNGVRFDGDDHIALTLCDIKENHGVSAEIINEEDLSDKLAEIIAHEFEHKISAELQQSKERCARLVVEGEEEDRALDEVLMITSAHAVPTNSECNTDDGDTTAGSDGGEQETEDEARLVEQGYMRYEGSPVSRMLGRLASLTNLSYIKKSGVTGALVGESRFGIATDRDERGLTIAMSPTIAERSDSAGRFLEGSNDERMKSSDSVFIDSQLRVEQTSSEDSNNVTSEVMKLLTKTLKGNLVRYVKGWMGPCDKPKDMVTVELVEDGGQLSRDDLREIRLRGNASFAPIWDSIDDVLHSTAECSVAKEDDNLVEILGKRRLFKHGKNNDNVKYLIKREIDIIDVGDISILCLPTNVAVLRANLTKRVKYAAKNMDEYSCSMKAVCDITAGMSANKVMKGKNCVIRNESLGMEMLMVPNHLNAYGKSLPVSDLIDALDCIALSQSDSLRLMTPSQLLKDMENGDDDISVSGILARQEYDTSSEYFSIVSVDAVDWRGKSGAPVVDSKGHFLGIILMQITDGKYFNVLNDAGVIICAKPSLIARPILHSTNVKLAKCTCCGVIAARRSKKADDSASSETSSITSGKADGGKRGQGNDDEIKECVKCAEIRGKTAEDIANGCSNNQAGTEKAMCADCLERISKANELSCLERGRRLLLGGMNYLMGRRLCNVIEEARDSEIFASKTGALERIGEILASEKKKRPDAGASDNVVIHNISEILYYSDQKAVDKLTRVVLKFVLEQLVKGCKPVIVCSTNTCCLTVTLLLSALRLRFERARSVSDLQRVCCAKYKKTRATTVVVSNEDVICSMLSKEKLNLSNQHYKVKCLVLTSDNDAIKDCGLATLKILSLFLSDMIVVMYDCRSQCYEIDSSDVVAQRKFKNVETKRANSYQNCGIFHHLQLSNGVIEAAEMNGFGGDADGDEIRSVIITMCNNANDYLVIKNRLCKAIEVNAKSILVTTHAAFASKQIWEVVRTCKNIYLHTGTKATYINDVVVNCSLETEMASSEKNLFLEAYRIASKLTMDDDYDDDTTLNVAMLKDMNSETNVDKDWFTIDYLESGTSIAYNAYELLKKVNHTLIDTNTIVQQVSVIENKFKTLRTDNEQVIMTLSDEDLINENLVLKKRVKQPILTAMTMRLERVVTSLKWAWHNMTIGALTFLRKIKNGIEKMLKRSRYVLKAKTMRFMSKLKKIGYGLVSKACTSLRVNKTAGYFNNSGSTSDASGSKRVLFSMCRCVGLANLAASVAGYKKKTFSDEKKLDNSIMVLMISAGFETISGNLTDGVRLFLESAGNLIAAVTSIGEVAYLLLGWRKTLVVGNWRLNSSGLSANKIVSVNISKIFDAVAQEMNSIEVVQTALIMDDIRTGSVDTVTYLNMYELGLSLYEVIRKLWMSMRLSWLFSNLRKGIEHRNDHPFTSQRGLEVVPCYEVGSAVSSVVLIGTTGVIALSLALRRVETAVSTIAVITEKRHTYDMVEVYKQDRDLGAILFRSVNIGYGIFLLSTGCRTSCIVGAASLCLGMIDLFTSSFSELGVCYSLSHIIVRMYTARNKVRAMINGWSAWYGGKSTVTNGLNALVITGMMLNPGELDVSSSMMNSMKLKMILAQNKERLANGVLMDKTVKASLAYDNAKMMILGRGSVNDLSDEAKWDHEAGASLEMLDLNLIANKGVGDNSWNSADATRVTLDNLTKNQCRFVGRTKKLQKFDKQMVPDEMIEHQSSVLALHDELWSGVVSSEDREGWGAAGDSRYAVLLAIAERNDSPIVLHIDEAVMATMASRGVELISKIIPSTIKVVTKVNSLDWLTVVCNINERATSGILTRLRTGQQVTAGYLPNYGYRSELLCEMMHDDSMPDECSVINVFAKRRVEKKKISRLTGVECVITRTIQANEVDLKVACSGSFIMLDKLIKLTKCHNGLAIGLNFFIEFAADELNTSAECYRNCNTSNIRRISLDHSSFDSSQRNWSITLCRELRILANEIMLLNDDREKRKTNELISKIYDGLLIRLMLTTHGDLFAVTGQQMSGHATTSSDNSIKAYLYAMVVCDLMKKSFHCEMIRNSLRAQGDDTKFDILINSDEVSDREISASISDAMSKLGQVVKSEKIEVLKIGESSSFLSNKCGLTFFIMRKGKTADNSWCESHLVPVRRRKDLVAMLATILKSSSNTLRRKTKKDVSLLAAKSMSFLTMYVGDALIARICITVIWICFKVLTAFKSVSAKMDITSTHLPWFVEQSGVKGEFEIKLHDLLAMHGIVRKELDVAPEYWLVDKLDPDYDMIDMPQLLIRNANKVFPMIKDWEEYELLNAIAIDEMHDNVRSVKISIDKVDSFLNGIREGLTLSIIDATVPYEPFNRLKSTLKENRTFISNLGLKKTYIVPEAAGEENSTYERVLRYIESPLSEETLSLDLTTKDGLTIKGMELRVISCRDYKIGVVDEEIKARIVETNPWNIIRLVYAKYESAELIHSLGRGVSDCLPGGLMITDLNLLNRYNSFKELNSDMNKSIEGLSLERLSKLKVQIGDEEKNTTRNIIISKDKLYWQPVK